MNYSISSIAIKNHSTSILRNGLLLMIYVIYSANLFSQKENNNWYFMNNMGIDFNSCPPKVINHSGYGTWENSTAISNPKTGELLFYTNATFVFDKNHKLMPNGKILANNSITQSAIVPHPNKDSSHLFFIFTTPFQGTETQRFQYHVVNMNLNNGLGDVVSKQNNLLDSTSNEKVIVIRSIDKKSFWIITHGFSNNYFYAFKINENGLEKTPIISKIGPINTNDCIFGAGNVGSLVASPDGKKLCYLNFCKFNFQLYDFDFSTGKISNCLDIETPILFKKGVGDWGGLYGASFSPNSLLLYITTAHANVDNLGNLYQFDISIWNKQSIESSLYFVDSIRNKSGRYDFKTFYRHLKLGPDSRLYIAKSMYNPSVVLADTTGFCFPAIHFPNLKGGLCKYDKCFLTYIPKDFNRSHNTTFIGTYGSWCLNNLFEINDYPKSIKKTGITKSIYCDKAIVKPLSINKQKGFQLFWSNGFSSDSIEINDSIKTWWVDIFFPGCDTIRDYFIINPIRQRLIGKNDIISCVHLPITLKYLTKRNNIKKLLWSNGSIADSIVVKQFGKYWVDILTNCDTIRDSFYLIQPLRKKGNVETFCFTNSFELSPTSTINNSTRIFWHNGTTSKTIKANSTGIYWVDLITACDTIRDSFIIKPIQMKKGNYTSVCPDSVLRASVNNPNTVYLWNNGFKGAAQKANSYGVYWVESFSNCVKVIDTFEVRNRKVGSTFVLSKDSFICNNSLAYQLQTDSNKYNIIWDIGQKGKNILFNKSGNYGFRITSKKGCDYDLGMVNIYKKPDYLFFIETAFRPNKDGRNDFFPSNISLEADKISLIQIYNRWGQLLYRNCNGVGWDGYYMNKLCPDGVYVYTINVKQCDGFIQFKSGTFHLIR